MERIYYHGTRVQLTDVALNAYQKSDPKNERSDIVLLKVSGVVFEVVESPFITSPIDSKVTIRTVDPVSIETKTFKVMYYELQLID